MRHHVTPGKIRFEATDDRSQNPFGLLMSHYTAADCASWMKETGFSETRAQHLVGPDAMVGIE